jgi:hypothetical protein
MRGKEAILEHWMNAVRQHEEDVTGITIALELLCDIRDTLVALGTLGPPMPGPGPG